MEEINEINEIIQKTDDFTNKNTLITKMNQMILIENKKLEKNLEYINNDELKNNTIPVKYKKYSVEKLEEMLYKTNDIDTQIIIYDVIKNKINNIEGCLFDNK